MFCCKTISYQILKMKKLFFLFLSLWVFSSCGTAKKQAVTYAPDQLVPKDKSLLWKVSGNGLDKPSWVFGTIHLIPKEGFKFSDATLSALHKSKKVAFEIDMKEMTNLRSQLSLMTKAFMKGGKTLRDLLPPEDYAFVRRKMDEKGLPITMLERLKPMFLSTMFSTGDDDTKSNTGELTSCEMEIYSISKREGKSSAGLETAAYQMAIFDSIPYELQAKMLMESLLNTEHGSNEFDQMLEMYQKQDIDSMHQMVANESSGMKDYENILLKNRNSNWIPVMGRLMNENSTFFAVGAGHLGGPGGVLALLRKKGYRVEPVN